MAFGGALGGLHVTHALLGGAAAADAAVLSGGETAAQTDGPSPAGELVQRIRREYERARG